MINIRNQIRKIIKNSLLIESSISGEIDGKEYNINVTPELGLIKIGNKKYKLTGKSLLIPTVDIDIIDIFEKEDKIMIKFSTIIKDGEMELTENVKNKIAKNYLEGKDIFEISGYLGTFTFTKSE